MANDQHIRDINRSNSINILGPAIVLIIFELLILASLYCFRNDMKKILLEHKRHDIRATYKEPAKLPDSTRPTVIWGRGKVHVICPATGIIYEYRYLDSIYNSKPVKAVDSSSKTFSMGGPIPHRYILNLREIRSRNQIDIQPNFSMGSMSLTKYRLELSKLKLYE